MDENTVPVRLLLLLSFFLGGGGWPKLNWFTVLVCSTDVHPNTQNEFLIRGSPQNTYLDKNFLYKYVFCGEPRRKPRPVMHDSSPILERAMRNLDRGLRRLWLVVIAQFIDKNHVHYCFSMVFFLLSNIQIKNPPSATSSIPNDFWPQWNVIYSL